jgi:hypothetical protein
MSNEPPEQDNKTGTERCCLGKCLVGKAATVAVPHLLQDTKTPLLQIIMCEKRKSS